MTSQHRSQFLSVTACAVIAATVASHVLAQEPGDKSAAAAESKKEVEVQSLREQLTEREDETRVEKPWTVNLFGHPLTVLGQYEAALEYFDQLALGDVTNHYGQLLLEQEIELEAFYTLGPWLSFFVQPRLIWEEDLDSETPDAVSDIFVERGEMWLDSRNIAGLPLSLEVGRLNFEDDRLWWWDEDLDAVRIIYENRPETFEVALAAAQELFSARSDRSFVEPENEEVFRVIAESCWDWSPNHAVEFFGLYHYDHSRTEHAGTILNADREDESDAELFWFGIRASGARDFEKHGVLGYWLDTGGVVGDERLLETDEISPEKNVVDEVRSLDVCGWGLDAGVTYVFPVAADPRITVGYAFGSGDKNDDNRTDHAFRQTGLQGNETAFGGVQRFKGYGRILEPELSNLSIVTAGVGCSLFKWSSLDLLFHDYRLVMHADDLRDSKLEAELTSEHRELGQGVDLVLAIEEWTRVEFEISASTFRAGQAFGSDAGEWIFGTFAAVRVAF